MVGSAEFPFVTPKEVVLTGKRLAFHYGLFPNEIKDLQGTSGWAEVGGNDFMVTMGSFAQGVGTQVQQAGTLMHELGHNLDLEHGGENGNINNCKSNYISVMNYMFQFPTTIPDRKLDYSRKALTAIDANNLVESVGVGSYFYPEIGDPLTNFPMGTVPTLQNTIYGGDPNHPSNIFPAGGGDALAFSTGAPVDWNRNTVIDAGTLPTTLVVANDLVPYPITEVSLLGCGPPTTLLTGHDDWAAVDLTFRGQAGWSTGVYNSITEASGLFFGIQTAEKLIPVRQAMVDELLFATACGADLSTRLLAMEAVFEDENLAHFVKLATVVGLLNDFINFIDTDDNCGDNPSDLTRAAAQVAKLEYLAEGQGTMNVEFSNITLDTEQHGTFGVTIFGTPVFDVTEIDRDTIFFGKEGQENTGAKPTHIPRNSDDVSRHLVDFDSDGELDALFHFRQEQIGLFPIGVQELCMVGALSDGLSTFEGCRLVDTFSSTNNIPDVNILEPAPGTNHPFGDDISMQAEAFDLEDGDITPKIKWFSSKVGLLHEGPVFTFLSSSSSYSAGIHIISAAAVDSDRGTGTDVSVISIGGGPASPLMEIEDTTATIPVFTTSGGSNQDKHLHVDLRVVFVDDPSTGVPDVVVRINLFKNGGFIGQISDLTDGNGDVKLSMNNLPPADYNFDIVNVRKLGIGWDLEMEPFESIVFTKAT